jgi:hypothetical protein
VSLLQEEATLGPAKQAGLSCDDLIIHAEEGNKFDSTIEVPCGVSFRVWGAFLADLGKFFAVRRPPGGNWGDRQFAYEQRS